jgi:hypothetical protein
MVGAHGLASDFAEFVDGVLFVECRELGDERTEKRFIEQVIDDEVTERLCAVESVVKIGTALANRWIEVTCSHGALADCGSRHDRSKRPGCVESELTGFADDFDVGIVGDFR